jgi:predicted nucleotide-binding protein
MATKRGEPKSVDRTTLIIPRQQFINRLVDRISKAEKLYVDNVSQLEQIERDYYKWDEINNEIIKQSFSRPDNEHYYKHSRLNTMSGLYDYSRGVDTNDPYYRLNLIKQKIENSTENLKLLIEKADLIDDGSQLVMDYAKENGYAKKRQEFSNKGFVIHGHNDTRKLEVARYLETSLFKTAVILHEQPSKGRTIIEKFEHHSSVDFAVALWTADDVGKGKNEDELKDRARQNVIFETGFFIGKLGRSNVIVLYETGVEIPSDYSGIIFILFADNWKDELRKEIEAIYN